VVKITLPLPPKALSPNARCHWAAVAKAKKKYRHMAMVLAAAQRPDTPWTKATMRATFYHKISRRRDGDNYLYMLKSALDSLKDAGVIVDDNHKVLTHLPVRFEVDKANPRVEIEVCPCENI
jgi:crossover junction endodeoxyribonuclease RusA